MQKHKVLPWPLSVSTLHLCFCPFMSRTTCNVPCGGASVSQTKSCSRSSSALGEDAASSQPDPYLRTAAPPPVPLILLLF